MFTITIYSIPNDLKDVTRNIWYQFYTSIFIFRAYTRVLTHTQNSSLEIFIAVMITNILDNTFLMTSMNFTQRLCFVAFVIHRCKVFARKFVYQFTTVWATVENKKQRFKVQIPVFIVYYTLGLPIWLSILIISSLLNTVSAPILGFPIFTVGTLAP